MLDPNAFLNMTVEGSLSTQLELPDEGDYMAQIVDLGAREIEFKNGERAGTTGLGLDVIWELTDPSVKEKLGYSPKPRQSMILDLTPSKHLDLGKGKNVTLGRIREAVGQNKDGQPWGFQMLKGQIATITVRHRTDDKDPSRVYLEVRGVKAA